MTTPSLVERLRHGLGELLHRPRDTDRELHWAAHEAELRREHEEAADAPVAGMRGMQPYDYGIRKKH
jgi:hypothetical protein